MQTLLFRLLVGAALIPGLTSCHGKSPLPSKQTATQPAKAKADVAGVPASLSPTSRDWPWWRGWTRDGHAEAGELPQSWGAEENLIWKTDLPGRGHSSPILLGELLVLTTATTDQQLALGFERGTGDPLWQTEIHRGGLVDKLHQRNSHATSTPATDGKHIFTCFLNSGAVFLTALNLEGQVVWQKRVTDFTSLWGFSTAPCLAGDHVIVAAEHLGMGVLAAYHRTDGREIWRVERTAKPNHTSPMLFRLAGQDVVVICGAERIAAYHPDTGKLAWESPGATTVECVGSVTAHGDRVFASGGYPKSETICVLANEGGRVAWRNGVKVYSSSLLARDELVLGVTDGGIAYGWDPNTGKELWSERLGAPVCASPVQSGNHIYLNTEKGETLVLLASRETLKVVQKNRLGDEFFASPVMADGRIYLRGATRRNGQRQEFLACVGKPSP